MVKPAALLLIERDSTPFDGALLAPRSHRHRLNGQRHPPAALRLERLESHAGSVVRALKGVKTPVLVTPRPGSTREEARRGDLDAARCCRGAMEDWNRSSRAAGVEALGVGARGCSARRRSGERARGGGGRRSGASQGTPRGLRTKRSAWAFACGARTGVRIILTPSLLKTSSKAPPNLLSRS